VWLGGGVLAYKCKALGLIPITIKKEKRKKGKRKEGREKNKIKMLFHCSRLKDTRHDN
jgi:hypothetical protein